MLAKQYCVTQLSVLPTGTWSITVTARGDMRTSRSRLGEDAWANADLIRLAAKDDSGKQALLNQQFSTVAKGAQDYA